MNKGTVVQMFIYCSVWDFRGMKKIDVSICLGSTVCSQHISYSEHLLIFVFISIITSMARNSLLCADVPLRNYSLTHSYSEQKASSYLIPSEHHTR